MLSDFFETTEGGSFPSLGIAFPPGDRLLVNPNAGHAFHGTGGGSSSNAYMSALAPYRRDTLPDDDNSDNEDQEVSAQTCLLWGSCHVGRYFWHGTLDSTPRRDNLI